MKPWWVLNRKAPSGVYPLEDIVQGLEKSKSLQRLFASKQETARTVRSCQGEVRRFDGYMWVNDENGRIIVSRAYLREGNEVHVYLDFLHEIVHVVQWRNGRELFDENYKYVDRPTEIEAYRVVVKEARSLGLSTEEIVEYLRVPWVTEEEFQRMLAHLGFRRTKAPRAKKGR